MIRSIAKHSIDRLGRLLPARDRSGKSLILAYHNVVPTGSRTIGDTSLHLSADKFEQQLEILSAETEITSLDRVLSPSDGSRPLAAVTFDDAYAGALELGVQMCISRGIPCTVFVAPNLLGCVPHWDREASAGRWSETERHQFLWEQRGLCEHLSWQTGNETEKIVRIATKDEMLRVSASPYVSFACHTLRHPNLAALTNEECLDEFRHSAEWLATNFGKCSHGYVAYPYGHAPLEARLVLEHSGLSTGFIASGMWFNPHHIDRSRVPRWNIPSGLSPDRFTRGLRGWHVSA